MWVTLGHNIVRKLVLLGSKIKDVTVGWTCSSDVVEKKYIHNGGEETSLKADTLKT